jgi:hypothetical protein
MLPDAVDVGYQLFNVAGAIEERIVSMQMKVGKFSHGIALVQSAELIRGSEPMCRTGAD